MVNKNINRRQLLSHYKNAYVLNKNVFSTKKMKCFHIRSTFPVFWMRLCTIYYVELFKFTNIRTLITIRHELFAIASGCAGVLMRVSSSHGQRIYI